MFDFTKNNSSDTRHKNEIFQFNKNFFFGNGNHFSKHYRMFNFMKKITFHVGQVGFDLLLGSIYSDFDLFWFRSAQDTNFKLPIIRSTRILICTFFDLHSFRSAIFGSAKISLCSVFDLHRF